ncbi:MAG TPA: hypothetical protein DD383_04255 [Rikenellaceae bacterium]|nr:hypothetical protein [Rikenellaceae bacterium]
MTVRGTGVRGFAKGRAFVVRDCGQRNPFEDIPPGSILVAERLSLSDSTLIDFRNIVGLVVCEEDADGQVCVLAKGIGVPAIVGISDCLKEIVTGDRLLIWNLDVLVNPDLDTTIAYEKARSESDTQLSLNLPHSTYY